MVLRDRAYWDRVAQHRRENKERHKRLEAPPTKDISCPCEVCGEVWEINLTSGGGLGIYSGSDDCCHNSVRVYLHDYAIREADVRLIRDLQSYDLWIY